MKNLSLILGIGLLTGQVFCSAPAFKYECYANISQPFLNVKVDKKMVRRGIYLETKKFILTEENYYKEFTLNNNLFTEYGSDKNTFDNSAIINDFEINISFSGLFNDEKGSYTSLDLSSKLILKIPGTDHEIALRTIEAGEGVSENLVNFLNLDLAGMPNEGPVSYALICENIMK